MNNARTSSVVLALSTLCATTAFAQTNLLLLTESTRPNTSETTLEQVLVTGEQPGPGLWKVSKGDHVLWIFGTYAPLPKGMTWRSRAVEAVIAESQEYLPPVEVDTNIGFFKGLTLLPSLIGIRNNPTGKTLSEVVDAELYARWLVQKEKYMGRDNGVETWRPSFAASELYEHAIKKLGFKNPGVPPRSETEEAVEKLAKRHKLKFITQSLPVEVPQPRQWVKEFKAAPIDDLQCFTKTIELLERDVNSLRTRANAWAIGNIAELRTQIYVDQRAACVAALYEAFNLPGAQQRGFHNIPAQLVAIWVAAAESALAKNKSTFAVLSIDDIYWKDGYIAALRSKGYTVEEP